MTKDKRGKQTAEQKGSEKIKTTENRAAFASPKSILKLIPDLGLKCGAVVVRNNVKVKNAPGKRLGDH